MGNKFTCNTQQISIINLKTKSYIEVSKLKSILVESGIKCYSSSL